MFYDPLGRTPEKRMPQTGAAMRCEHDQLDPRVLGMLADGLPGLTEEDRNAADPQLRKPACDQT